MSLQRGCLLVERHPGQWFCAVASQEYDYDFSGHYTVYGPKATAEAAFEEMHDHEANPGSSSEIPHDKLDALTIDLIDKGLRTRRIGRG